MIDYYSKTVQGGWCRIMYFADLLTFVDKELCIQKFLERCEDVPDIDRLTTALSQAIDNLKSLRPNFSDKSTIHFIDIKNKKNVNT